MIAVDSYDRFIKAFGIKKIDLYNWGIKETVKSPKDVIDKEWLNLKGRLFKNEQVFIRGAGRDAKGTQMYLDFYKILFGNSNIKKDPTNNMQPQKIIQRLTGYKRNQTMFNYQVSHIFGKTKNPLMFEAPWNIVFVPKIIDPFTGHETKGRWPLEYQDLFIANVKEEYSEYIYDYNKVIGTLNIRESLAEFIDKYSSEYDRKEMNMFIKRISDELSLIEI